MGGQETRAFNLTGLFSSLGITAMILWCKLMGHTSAFYLPLAGLGTWANARVFWLTGILAAALLCLLLPRALHRVDAMQRYVIPLVATVGGTMFALAFHQDFFDQRTFAVVGVVVSGFGYFWFISRFVLLLALTQGVACLAWAFSGAFVLRQVLLILMDAYIPLDYQVMTAIALPLCAVAFLALARAAARRADRRADGCGTDGREGRSAETGMLWGIRTLPKEQRIDRREGRYLLVMVIAVALLLSAARACSISGTWGSDHTKDLGLTAIPSVALYAAGICALVYLGVVRPARAGRGGMANDAQGCAASGRPVRGAEMSGFLAGIFIVMTGLLVAAFEPSLTMVPAVATDLLTHTNDPFALVFFWSTVALAIQRLSMPPNRVIGMAGSVYAAASIAWVFLISDDNAVDSAFVLAVVYVLFALVVAALSLRERAQVETSAGTVEGPRGVATNSATGEDAPIANANGPAKDATPAPNASALLVAAIQERCVEIARNHSLSPRETDVLLLIAQGRTGGAIQDELGVAASTVKTHTQHIYTKLGVSDRQELMDLVLGMR